MSDLLKALDEIQKVFREATDADTKHQEEWWDTLTPEQQIDAFCCVARRIYQGDVVEQGSYRYVLYDVCNFGPEAYVPAQLAGYLDIHNLIYDGLRYRESSTEVAEEVALLEKLIDPPEENA